MVSLAVTTRERPAALPPETLCSWRLRGLRVSRGAQPARGAPADGAILLIPYGQPLSLRQPTMARLPLPPADLLYLPAEDTGLHAAGFDGWCLGLDVQPLCLLGAELTDHRLSPARFRRRLTRAQPLRLRLAPERDLRQALLHLLQMGDSEALRQQDLMAALELDRLIQRLVVLLLCGDLIHGSRQGDGLEPGDRQRVFEDLLSWIRAHLHEPIQLQDLVRQSGYSQRSLRNFFRERFGCGPVHWIRSQRLALARERLLNPESHDSVSTIAAALGYGHPSQFSRDFQQAFGRRPSTLLREGRRSHRLD